MESKRQLQVASQIQRVISEILQQDARIHLEGAFVTVSGVKITPDLLTARIYISIFQAQDQEKVLDNLNQNIKSIRRVFGNKMRNKVRRIPELTFYRDDTLDEVFEIEQLLGQVLPKKADDSEE